ncbi:MAG: 4-hydroxy-tetrahydrodipicolinate reductase [Planctomycetota bacterium]
MNDRVAVAVNGAKGRMGQEVVAAVRAAADLELVAECDMGDDLLRILRERRAAVVVDFTHPHAARANTLAILDAGACPVIGTTGFSSEDLAAVEQRCRQLKRGGVIAPNFAIGAVLMIKLCEMVARWMPDCEILELHHEAKADAPSGTAVATAQRIAAARTTQPMLKPAPTGHPEARGFLLRDVAIHSVRLPGLMAHQEVIFGTSGQTLRLTHDALNRSCYMPGVLLAIRRVRSLPGLVVGLDALLGA